MSYRLARGKLRDGTSGGERSQAACVFRANRPRKGDWSDLWLDVIVRRTATSDRSMVTAAKWVYSAWKFTQPGRGNGEEIYRNRSAPEPVHVLYPAGEWALLSEHLAAGGSAALCEEAAAERRNCGGDHGQYEVVLRRGTAACSARGGGRHQPVPGDQPVGEEDRRAGRGAAGVVFEQGAAAGGAHER